MNDYRVEVPRFVGDDVDSIYDTLYDYGFKTAENFYDSFEDKLEQIERHPFSCAVDMVYPLLTEKGVRKAVINHGRYIVLYFIEGKQVIVIAVERAERDYIATFEANLKLYEDDENRDG